jgi:hypothetical protein
MVFRPISLIVFTLSILASLSELAVAQNNDATNQADLEKKLSTVYSAYARAALKFTSEEERIEFYTDLVNPIFESRCIKCHGDKKKGGLRLDTREHILKGGESNAAIIPKDADKSLLVQAILHTHEDLKMPKGKLPQGEIDILKAWVTIGAPAPKAPEPKAIPAKEPDPAPKPRVRRPIIKMALEKGAPLSFNRDIRPILSDNCFICHGPDEKQRKAGLRLDLEKEAFKALSPGYHALVPANIEQSLLFQRIITKDEDDVMPPKDYPKQLKQEQIETIGRWILQGAPWEPHWAFAKAKTIEIPQVEKSAGWTQNTIDNFVLNTIEQKGFTPNKSADKRTLARRATLDLTGLPPIPADIEAFVNDDSPDAYEKLLDRLLAIPEYGEHLGRIWLDAARYADTNGYHIDNTRNMWRWREWVIDSFNNNKPFDEFTIEQIAGDLLENPTTDQLIATGFNRNHMVNFEGGAIPEEYRIQYVSDRLETTGTVWMGLTLNCAKCHDHKYDPISQKEYYQLFAFFNTIDEKGLDGNTPTGNSQPMIDAPNSMHKAKQTQLEHDTKLAKEALYKPISELDTAFESWKKDSISQVALRWTTLIPTKAAASGNDNLNIQKDLTFLAEGVAPEKGDYIVELKTDASNISALKLDTFTTETYNNKIGRFDNGNFVLTEFEVEYANPDTPDKYRRVKFVRSFADIAQPEFPIDWAIDGKQDTGWAPHGMGPAGNRSAIFVASEPFGYKKGTNLRIKLTHQSVHKQHLIAHFKISATEETQWSPVKPNAWYIRGPYQAKTKQQATDKNFVPGETIDLKATYDDQRAKWSKVLPVLSDGQVRDIEGGLSSTYFYRRLHSPSNRRVGVAFGATDGIRVWLNGEQVLKKEDAKALKENKVSTSLDLLAGKNELLVQVANFEGNARFYFNITNDPISGGNINQLLVFGEDESNWRQEEKDAIYHAYRSTHWDQWVELDEKFTKLNKELKDHIAQIPKTMVMGEMGKPRKTFILDRGDYASPLDEVTPDTPESLVAFPKDFPKNRLGLAQWLVDGNNPLTARVTVNRIWSRFFGKGLVTTPEDFGSQGALPTHPELLEWLAQDFIHNGWDLKALQKQIMMSATYKQSSKVNEEKYRQDTKNIYLARGSRFRVDAEVVRDSALAISGLLVNKKGGQSVLPYQPAGLWKEVGYGGNFTGQTFVQDKGENLYRRSMYTFWKRTSPPPSMMLFDAPNRETCSVSRGRSNTPLQALTLMNDPQFVEAARALGQRMIEQGGDTAKTRIDFAFMLATARHPNEREMTILSDKLYEQLESYSAADVPFSELLQVGDSEYNKKLNECELAAYSVIASLILNLDETITRN